VADAQTVTVDTEAASLNCLGSTTDADGSRGNDGREPANAGLNFTLDEHVLANPRRDMDYDGGGEITVSGARAADNWLSVDRALRAVDRFAGIDAPTRMRVCGPTHAFAAGVLEFAPRDLRQRQPLSGDRPYASLFFLSNGRRYVLTDRAIAYSSSLTVGLLGLSAAGSMQRAIHHVIGSAQPEGWAHQISAGGEPTARYSLARQSLLSQHAGPGRFDSDWTWTAAGSVGTVTEASIALNSRWGRIVSPWWSTSPEQSMYVAETRPAAPPLPAYSRPEFFALMGARFKVRAYNAFLQGQFRHSDLTYGPGDLNALLGEAWVGAEVRTASGFELRYLARWESPELRRGVGSRSFVWGSVELSKSFGAS
jgi:hypothetical protein